MFTLTVLLFTDEPMLELGLQAVLGSSPEFKLLGVCRNEAGLLAEAEKHQPHLIVYSAALDPALARVLGVRRLAPESAIVLCGREFSTEVAHQAMELGVRGFLSTTSIPETIRECLRFAATGEMWMERSLANNLLNSKPVSLSRRQGQLVSLLVQGLKNREIATALGISEGTVKAYLTTLFEKVGARDRFELALFGLKNLRTVREAETSSPKMKRLRGEMRDQFRERGRRPSAKVVA